MSAPSILARPVVAAVLLLGGLASGLAAPPKVVVSIKPVHALVARVMQGVAVPGLIVEGAASGHGYQLKPSDAARLQAADMVIRIGSGLENYLDAPLKALAARAVVVELAEEEGVTLLPPREGGVWAPHEHEDEHGDAHEAHDDAGHEHGEADYDPHLWLDPANARVIVARVADRLALLDPPNAATYAANAAAAAGEFDALDRDLAATLAPVKGKPFIVFHDAYHYFEARYGLAAAGSITVSPDRAPGAERLSEIRAAILERKADCVFSEPQFEPRLVRVVTEGTQAKTGVLDPLGAALPAGPGLYAALMRANAAALVGCLGGS